MPIRSWHPGEVAAQEARGYGDDLYGEHVVIQNGFPPNHRAFYPILCFLPLATLDDNTTVPGGIGRPWMSLLTARDGRRGFCSTWDPSTWDKPEVSATNSAPDTELRVRAYINIDDPARKNLASGKLLGGRKVVAGVGVELLNRRRNKFAGHIGSVDTSPRVNDKAGDLPDEWDLSLQVENALGNCPKYINTRVLIPKVNNPHVIASSFSTGTATLPKEALNIIVQSDLVFLATVYKSVTGDESRDPSRLGANLRGGRPGFVRTAQEDDATVIYVPDFSGNRFMQSIGNIQSVPLAGLTVPSFGADFDESSTRVLYTTGDATVLYGEEASKIMRSARALIRIVVRDYVLIGDAMPLVLHVPEPQVSHTPATVTTQSFPAISHDPKAGAIGWSPYNPPVWTLKGEEATAIDEKLSQSVAKLEDVTFHSPELATFTWTTSGSGTPLSIKPGQHVVLNMSAVLNDRYKSYSHMAQFRGGEKYLNDDGVRSYTVSRIWPPISNSANGTWTVRFTTTLRRAEAGAITPGLFYRAMRFRNEIEESQDDEEQAVARKRYGVHARLVGLGGELTLTESQLFKQAGSMLLYLVNGIGITPLLAHFDQIARLAVAAPGISSKLQIVAIIACRAGEFAIIADLIRSALSYAVTSPHDLTAKLGVDIHIMSRNMMEDSEEGSPQRPATNKDLPWLQITEHVGLRLAPNSLVPVHSQLDAQNSLWLPLPSRNVLSAFICGSSAFEPIAREAVRQAGVPEDKMLSESFSF